MLLSSQNLVRALRCAQHRVPKANRFSSLAVSPTDHLSILSLPAHYLRAVDPSNVDPFTMQRTDVAFDTVNGKPPAPHARHEASSEMVDCYLDGHDYRIQWKDGLVSTYATEWVEETLQQWQGAATSPRVLETGLTAATLRSSPHLCLPFDHVLTETGMDSALLSLYKHGIVLVKDTPIDDNTAGLAALASALGGGSIKNSTNLLSHYSKEESNNAIVLPHGTDGPLRTLYGTIWSTSSSGQAAGSSMADSAYGHEGLPLHTDMTYSRDPPGLQIFIMVQPATSGGESIYCDGFAAADRLRRTHPDAFAVLSQTERRFRCMDSNTGWHLEASGPVIEVNAAGEIVLIRHNDLDRLPDLPQSASACESHGNEFYDALHAAHEAWNRILAQDDIRLVIGLEPGETMVVANQRWMHGRFAFDASPDAPRVIMGCFTGQDELNSRFRMLGCDSH